MSWFFETILLFFGLFNSWTLENISYLKASIFSIKVSEVSSIFCLCKQLSLGCYLFLKIFHFRYLCYPWVSSFSTSSIMNSLDLSSPLSPSERSKVVQALKAANKELRSVDLTNGRATRTEEIFNDLLPPEDEFKDPEIGEDNFLKVINYIFALHFYGHISVLRMLDLCPSLRGEIRLHREIIFKACKRCLKNDQTIVSMEKTMAAIKVGKIDL